MTTDHTPQTTNNMLADIIGWLKAGDLVILHVGTQGKGYHVPNIPFGRKIYIDVKSMPSLINEEEWPWYMIDYAKAELVTTFETECPNGTYNFKIPGLGH
jgi:hypothetical protein